MSKTTFTWTDVRLAKAVLKRALGEDRSDPVCVCGNDVIDHHEASEKFHVVINECDFRAPASYQPKVWQRAVDADLYSCLWQELAAGGTPCKYFDKWPSFAKARFLQVVNP